VAVILELQEAAHSLAIIPLHVHVIDRTPPTIAQFRDVCRVSAFKCQSITSAVIYVVCQAIDSVAANGMSTLVHCQGGVGRTNTMIMAYLMWASTNRAAKIPVYSENEENIRKGTEFCSVNRMSASDAHLCVSSQRKVLMTVSQDDALKLWYKQLSSEDGEVSKVPDGALGDDEGPPKPESFLNQMQPFSLARTAQYLHSTYKSINFPPLIVCMGLPGSGKSTLSKLLTKALPTVFFRINRDEMRGKGQVDAEFAKAAAAAGKRSAGHTGTVIIDCCNLTISKRKEWIEAAHHGRAWCIFLDIDVETCKQRVMHRADHPTIPAGQYGVSILK
jgi:hypothetical protein